jgi:hypothetical protein
MTKTIKAASGSEKATAFRLPSPLLKKLKYISVMEETTQTDLIEKAILEIIAKYEKKNGTIPVK